MSRLSHGEIIDKLALSCGIEARYRDNWGRIQETSLETKQKILKAMGIAADTPKQASEAWRARSEGKEAALAEPTIVVNLYDLPKELILQVPVKARGAQAKELKVSLAVSDEQGVTQDFSYTHEDLSWPGTTGLTATTRHRLAVPFPRLQALGYYWFQVLVTMGDEHESQTVFVAVCPDKAFLPASLQGDRRTAGIAISLYGVRSEKNWGVGDFGDLKEIVDWVAEDLHGSVVGLNPLHALFNRRPFNISPYLPMSRFYRNFIYLDIPAMEGYQDSPGAQALVNSSETQSLLSELRASKTVQYEQVAALKHDVLKEIFKIFLKYHWNNAGGKTDLHTRLEGYIQREGLLLHNFATYCALDAAMRSRNPEIFTWLEWPAEYQRPDTEAVRQFQRERWQEVLFYKYVQWELERQLEEVQKHARSRGMCVGLYHDLALAVDRFSADFWAYQDFFLPKLRVGAPPDAFSQNGQDWGFHPPDMERLRETGYDLFIKEIQKNCAHAGAVRIDHVMRFFHLYCMSEGEPPDNGAYVSQPVEDLLKLVCLESVRNRVVIIGEDLGTVPASIRDRLSETNILSYRLLYFERDDQQGFIVPQDYPELALVTVTTHDLPTLAGFWSHRDIEVRKEAGLFDSEEALLNTMAEREADKRKLSALLEDLGLLAEDRAASVRDAQVAGELHNAIVGFLALTPAKLFILSQEDLFKEKDQQNLPGTTQEYPNWSLKMKYTVEQLRQDPTARGFCDMFREWIHRSGRNEQAV